MTSFPSFRLVGRRTSLAQRLLLVSLVGVASMGAQAAGRPVTSQTLDATRTELTRRLDSLLHVDSTRGKATERRERRNEIVSLRTRLTDGDFRPGDRFIIDFGDPTRRADTVVVRDSSNVSVSNWPAFTLRGVLRSELQPAMMRYVGTYFREPRFRISPLTRFSVVGGVARPGVYNMEPAQPLSDALMLAGGIGPTARNDGITVYRGDSRLLSEKQVAEAMRTGATFEQLGIQPGDQIRVKERREASRGVSTQTIFFMISAIAATLALIRASYNP